MDSATPAQDLPALSSSIPTPPPRGGERLYLEPLPKRRKIGTFTTFRVQIPNPAL